MTAIGAASSSIGMAPEVRTDEASLDAAKQAVTKAQSAVATDKLNHSPSCVAVDQKQVNTAEQQLAQAQTQLQANGVLNVTV